ncbi:hypothetical protein GQR58_028141 [Nymphon striatum]|nr:hypothetical protein GQR58_028141 [Nymphon striatum]
MKYFLILLFVGAAVYQYTANKCTATKVLDNALVTKAEDVYDFLEASFICGNEFFDKKDIFCKFLQSSANRFLLACTLEHVNAANIQKFIGFFIQCKEVGEDICSLVISNVGFKKLRVTRRNAKAALTRIGTSIIYAIDNRRPIEELRVAVKRLETAFAEVVDKHEKLTECIEEEEIFEKEEKWLNEVQRDFLELETKANDYVIEGQTKNEEEKTVAQGSSVQGDDSVVMNGNEQLQKVKCEQLLHDFDNKQFSCKYKFDKPKMPVFFGDVRDYGTFKSDFKHSIESVYSKRDSILLLRNCLQGKPLDLIKGIGTDYDAAWEYLDAIYGDPRVVADVVTQDIVQFKNLREGEDGRFCDLVHLVRRSCNTLKEVGRPHDMDNNHMLAIIEQKMVLDDRKVWARNLEKDGTSATLDNLLQWMTSEMKCRMRATASVRNTGYKGNTGYSGYKSSTGYTTKCSVNVIGADNVRPYRCWICQSNDHWVDQCRTFLGKSVEERRQLLKNGYACYSCLKKCGKGHNWTNCSRRQRCSQVINGERCSQFHHNLLHYRPLAGIVNTVVESEHQSLLPVVQAEVLGSKGKCIANVLLDSGAQVSLIRIRVAEQLELRGQPVSTKIIKIGGVEEEINTKLYYFKVRPMNKSELFEIRAIGIPDISEDLCEVNLKDLSQQFNIPGQDLHRKQGPIDLLVGVDYAEMHVGPTRRTNNMVARLSPLGWVVFGSNVADDTFVNQHLHRYMWRDLKTSAEPDHYVKTVLTFGDKAAPAMALTALRKTAEGNENQYPGASQTVKLNSYMDDICDSVPTIEEANALIQDIESLLDSGGFHIKRWYSNEKISNFVDHTGQLSDQNGNFLNSPTGENILGLVWNRTSDLLFYKMDPDKNELSESRCYTKRIILSRVSRLFDPVGFLAAFLVRAKIGLQELWARALEWDEEVPSDLKEKWNAFFEEMRSVKNVRFKRCLTPEFTVNSPFCAFSQMDPKGLLVVVHI